ncbi:MAG: hypothetical protein K0S61_4223 [Anaerocolumna sp.]|nr:hypothetical protein [Anaerocolumna sp.]
MYNIYRTHSCPYCNNTSRYNQDNMYNAYRIYQCPYLANIPMYDTPFEDEMKYGSRFDFPQVSNSPIVLKDYGPQPFVVNINEATKQNQTFRTALWTGNHLQVTLMSINVGDDIGLEVHPNVDQFIRIEDGQGIVKMGRNKNRLDFQANVYDDFAIMIPAGTWHNIINTGNKPLKVYTIYAPPEHPHGVVHVTKPAE